MLNSVGIIDLDYCGKEDSIKLNLYNLGEKEVVIEKGERIGQVVFLRFEKPELEEVSDIEIFDKNSRGGFGSTDK
jgi:dUTP pyrophosphatase